MLKYIANKIKSPFAAIAFSLLILVSGVSVGCAGHFGQDPVQSSQSLGVAVEAVVYETLLVIGKKYPEQIPATKIDFQTLALRLDAFAEQGVSVVTVVDSIDSVFERIVDRFWNAEDETVQAVVRNLPVVAVLLSGYFKTEELSDNGKLYVKSIAKAMNDGVNRYDENN